MSNLSLNNLNNLKNLALIGGSFEKCRVDTMKETMGEYKDGTLKSSSGQKVKDRKQALAIGLSKVEQECKHTKGEVDELIEKVKNDLNEKDKELNLSNVIETKQALEKLSKKGGKSYKLVYVFKKLLWDKIIKAGRENSKLDKNMWDEIKHIHEL